MRSEFRFPRSTTALVSVILGGVILAIEKGKAVQASVSFTHPRLPPIRPVPPTFPQAIAIMFAARSTAWPSQPGRSDLFSADAESIGFRS